MTNGTPSVATVTKLAVEAMKQHGLEGWTFKFNTNKRRLGVCKYTTLYGKKLPGGAIELSIHILNLGWAQIQDTILHEIAHALAPSDANHGYEWKVMAMKIGARPERCARGVGALVEGRYLAKCPRCGYERRMHKRSRVRRACGPCCRRFNRGQFHPDYLLEYVDTHGGKETHRQIRRALRRQTLGSYTRI